MKVVLALLFWIAQLSGAQPISSERPSYNTSTYVENGLYINRKQVNLTFIPEGATDNTWVDYWMNGSYSTLVRSDGDRSWEISMTLHTPTFVD